MKNNQGSEHDHENETESEMRDEDLNLVSGGASYLMIQLQCRNCYRKYGWNPKSGTPNVCPHCGKPYQGY